MTRVSLGQCRKQIPAPCDALRSERHDHIGDIDAGVVDGIRRQNHLAHGVPPEDGDRIVIFLGCVQSGGQTGKTENFTAGNDPLASPPQNDDIVSFRGGGGESFFDCNGLHRGLACEATVRYCSP